MTERKQRFMVMQNNFQPCLMIVDYVWWMDNEREILNWMVDNLPGGIEQQQGMIVSFDTDRDRMSFLLRWS